MTSSTYTPWQLARLADCMDPDTPDSPGARFLESIADSVAELMRDYPEDDRDDAAHEIADSAVPVYTHEMWATFVDLGAYQEDPTDLGGDADDMTRAAGVCLYLIAARLAAALIAAHEPDEEDEEDEEDE